MENVPSYGKESSVQGSLHSIRKILCHLSSAEKNLADARVICLELIYMTLPNTCIFCLFKYRPSFELCKVDSCTPRPTPPLSREGLPQSTRPKPHICLIACSCPVHIGFLIVVIYVQWFPCRSYRSSTEFLSTVQSLLSNVHGCSYAFRCCSYDVH